MVAISVSTRTVPTFRRRCGACTQQHLAALDLCPRSSNGTRSYLNSASSKPRPTGPLPSWSHPVLPLRELQQRFASRLLETDSASVLDWIRSDGISALARLQIYRNNLHAGFTKTLALEFPVIQRLIGPGCFSQLALEFLGYHPSRSGDLHHVGAP